MSPTDVERRPPVAQGVVCSFMQSIHYFIIPKGEHTDTEQDVIAVRQITPEPEPEFERFFFPTVGDEVGTARTHLRRSDDSRFPRH